MLNALRMTYVVEAVYMAVLGVLTLMRGLDLLTKVQYRFIVPSIGLLASLTLLGLRFISRDGLPSDILQQQHLLIGAILGVASILALIGFKLQIIWFDVATVIALVAIGTIFLTPPSETATSALSTQHTVGIILLIGVFIHAGATFSSQWYKPLTLIAGITLLFSALLLVII